MPPVPASASWFAALLWLPALLPGQNPVAAPKPVAKPFSAIAAEADTARQQNRLDDAVKLYRQTVHLRPAYKEGWWFLGTIQYGQDKFPECRDALRKFVVLEPGSGAAYALLGLCEFQTKEFAPALTRFEKAMTLGLPDGEQLTSVAQYHHSMLLTKAENFERALLILTVLARKGTPAPEVIALAGIAAMRRAIFPHELPEEDRNLAILMGRAVVSAAERQVAEAQKLFEELIAQYPDKANVHYVYGAFVLPSNPDLAIKEFEKEVAISGDHLPALVSLAMEHLKRGEPVRALDWANRAAKTAPGNFAARTARGRALVESGRLPEGVVDLELAVKLAPDSPQVRIALASAYAQLGRKEDAARERAEFSRLRKMLDASEAPK